MKNSNNIATYDPKHVVYWHGGAAMALDFPIYRSPGGKTFKCIAYAVQTEQPDDPRQMNLTEWYLFEEKISKDDIEYLGLEQGAFSESIRRITKREIESNYGVTIIENVETLNALLPPVGWEKLR